MSAVLADFHGVWRLVRWTVQLDDGKLRSPFGGEVEGYLCYSPAGWVSATLMERGRTAVCEDRLAVHSLRRTLQDDPGADLDMTQRDLLRDYFLAANGYVSYSGPFDIDDRSVHHRVQVSLLPQWVGTTLSREYRFDEDGASLTLTAAQPGVSDRLVWERHR